MRRRWWQYTTAAGRYHTEPVVANGHGQDLDWNMIKVTLNIDLVSLTATLKHPITSHK